MKLSIPAGTTSKRIGIFIQDSSSTTGAGLTGLAFNSAGLTCYSWIDTDGNVNGTSQALQTATKGTWTTRGFVEKDATNLPGFYEFGIPDALLAAGVKWAIVMFKGATNMAPIPLEIEVTAVSNQDAVRGGMTALPNANAEAAGGLYTRGSGAGQLNQSANGQADVNVARWLNTAVSTPTVAGVPNVNAKTWNDLTTVALPLVPATAGRTLVVDAAGLADANVVKVGPTGAGTAQTAGDIMADTNDIQTRLPAALVGGRMDSSVGAMAANVLTNAAIANNAINDAKVDPDVTVASVTGAVGSVTGAVGSVTGAVGSVTGAVGSVTGNVGGNVVGSVASVTGNVGGNVVGSTASVTGAVGSVTGNVGGNLLGTLSATERNAISDALLDRNMATGTDNGSAVVRTPRQALRFLRNKWSIAAATLTVTKEDDATSSWTGTVTQTAGNPVSTIDPA